MLHRIYEVLGLKKKISLAYCLEVLDLLHIVLHRLQLYMSYLNIEMVLEGQKTLRREGLSQELISLFGLLRLLNFLVLLELNYIYPCIY